MKQRDTLKNRQIAILMKRWLTSRPKTSNGQQSPCPASLYWPRSSFVKQGSGPNREQCPVEWGDSPYVHTYVPPLGPSQPGLRLRQSGKLDGPRALRGERTYRCT